MYYICHEKKVLFAKILQKISYWYEQKINVYSQSLLPRVIPSWVSVHLEFKIFNWQHRAVVTNIRSQRHDLTLVVGSLRQLINSHMSRYLLVTDNCDIFSLYSAFRVYVHVLMLYEIHTKAFITPTLTFFDIL
jgi:hypothetical protein